MRERTVLVMWEYGCDHSPLWARSADVRGGPIDVADLGVGSGLRDALADWNDRCEDAADADADADDSRAGRTPPSIWRPLGAEGFLLAASLQRALNDDWTVWCLAGGGDGGLRDPDFFPVHRRDGPQLVLRASGLVEWEPDRVRDALPDLPHELQDRWRRWADAAGSTAPAECRTTALELAGAVHAALPAGRVLWFGGEDVP